MKIKLFVILALALFMISCKSFIEDVAEDMVSDPTGDTVAVVEDDTGGDTITIEIPAGPGDPVGEDDPPIDSDDGDPVGEDDPPIDSDDGDIVVDNDNPEPDDPPVIVVEIPKNELLTHVNIGDAKALALSPRNDSMNSSASLFGRMMSIVGGDGCQELLDFSTQEAIATEGSVPCFSNVEMYGEFTFANYYLYDVTESPELMFLSQTPIDFSIIIDASGNVHHLPGQPKRRNSFKNIKMIKSHNSKPTYINKDNKLVWFDLSSDTEIMMIEEAVTNFSIKPYSDGDHFVVDSTAGVKRIKPDQSEEMLPELTPGNYHDIGGSIQYVSGSEFRRMVFNDDGNITDRNGSSVPETFSAWVRGEIALTPINFTPRFFGSISGCTDEAVGNQRVMICNGKAFRVKEDDEDLEQINWCNYGNCGFNSWSTVKMCASGNYMYFYSEYDSGNLVLTWIDLQNTLFRYIPNNHQIIDLECTSDSELAVIGTIGELTETLSITEADTVSPVVTVIDSQITDVITP